MGLKFLDLAVGLPHFWNLILGKIESHNSSAIAHGDIRDDIEALETAVSGKVDAVSGKGLSTNDYTTAEKTKLAGIAEGATKITIDSSMSSTSTNPVQNRVVNTALSSKVDSSIYSTKVSSIESSITDVSDALTAFKTTKGKASGIVPLNESSKIDSAYLPSYVDDVLEYTAKENFPDTGESGKIYVDTTTNLTYRWSGSAYVEISPSIALGITSSTAFRGDYGNAAYAHAVTNKGVAASSGLYKITTNSEGHVTAATAVEKADLTDLGVADASLYLPLTGGTLTGALTANENITLLGNLLFKQNNTTEGTIFYNNTNKLFAFLQKKYTADGTSQQGYDTYSLPSAKSNSVFGSYSILTTKDLITVEQGGTGALTAEAARENLGAAASEHTHSLTADSITDILPITKGGTGVSTASEALTNLGAVNKVGDTMTGVLEIDDGDNQLYLTNKIYGNGFTIENGSLGGASLDIFAAVPNSPELAPSTSSFALFSYLNDEATRTPFKLTEVNNEWVSKDEAFTVEIDNVSHRFFYSGMETAIPIANGGTGATSAADALNSLGGVGYTVISDLSSLL